MDGMEFTDCYLDGGEIADGGEMAGAGDNGDCEVVLAFSL